MGQSVMLTENHFPTINPQFSEYYLSKDQMLFLPITIRSYRQVKGLWFSWGIWAFWPTPFTHLPWTMTIHLFLHKAHFLSFGFLRHHNAHLEKFSLGYRVSLWLFFPQIIRDLLLLFLIFLSSFHFLKIVIRYVNTICGRDFEKWRMKKNDHGRKKKSFLKL